ncbi:hypothetical protein [Spirosoma validum]|uniref:Uncharacterized protein n=1 Tax=Spirosoma validum TaxID=2771355 RepID=A0A927B254_9BACT|nr:hypothetical protein [Spirosoma validum]MBD2754205.1 hypothetical protein [Spirosoma validum]
MKTVLFVLLLSPVILWAQSIKITPEDTHRKHSYLVMRDGSVVRGQILRQDSSLITVRVRGGDLSFIEADQVVQISANRPGEAINTTGLTNAPVLYNVFVFKDGTQVEGKYVRRDSTMITVRKRNGQLTYFEPELLIRVDTIRTGIESSESPAFTDRLFANRFSPWLLTGQTAYNPEKGRFYYRNTLGLLNEFDYGITHHWSVGASFVLPVPYLLLSDHYAFRGFLPIYSQLFSKLSLPIGEQFSLGIHANYKDNGFSTRYKRGPLTLQALASVGTSQRNVTVGYGLVSRGKQNGYQYNPYPPYGPLPFDIATPNQSFLTMGVIQKLSPTLTLLSDNRVNLGEYNLYYYDMVERASLSVALRLDRRRHAFDLGVYGLLYRENYKWDGHLARILPYLGYNLIIGRD